MLSIVEALGREYTLSELRQVAEANLKQAESWIAWGAIDVPSSQGVKRVFSFANLVEARMCAKLINVFGRLETAAEILSHLRDQYRREGLTIERILGGDKRGHPYLFLVRFLGAQRFETDHRRWQKLELSRVEPLWKNLGRLTDMAFPGTEFIHIINPSAIADEVLRRARAQLG